MSGSKVQPAPVKGFLERLQDGVVVGDGAMGTMLYARGVFVNRCFDELNLSNPALVRSVHEEYLESGADVVETNTFGAHRFKLGPHGFEGQVVKINREGARIARAAAQGQALVASLTFNEEGTTAYGEQPEDVVRTAEEWDVAVVGANCSQGPQQMLETVKRMAAA